MGGGIVGEDNDEGARLRTTGIEPDQFAERTDSSVTVICLLLAFCCLLYKTLQSRFGCQLPVASYY